MNIAFDLKGWCPGALRPMPSGDGLIVRVRPFCGALTLEQAAGLARLARTLGNGHLDLTRRANVQLRGLAYERLAELHAELGRLSLLDRDAETEARRNIMVSPLAGLDPAEHLDMRPIAASLDRMLASAAKLEALPAKFGMLVDGGGAASIAGERADICLAATGRSVALGLDAPAGTRWLGSIAPDRAVGAALAAAHAFVAAGGSGRMRDHVALIEPQVRPLLQPLDAAPVAGSRRLGLLPAAIGVAAPFGRLEAAQLQRLVSLAAGAGAPDLRLSPWRSLYIGIRDEALLEGARAAGLIVDERDPLLRIEACPGAPDCRSGTVDTRSDARALAAVAAARGYRGRIHVSGCAKRCACSTATDLTLIGEEGHYRVGKRIVRASNFRSLVEAAHG